VAGEKDAALLTAFEPFKNIVSEIRTIRKDNQIPQRDALTLHVQVGEGYPANLEPAIA
jgi:valyl-tRNA synthetase